MAHLIRPRYTNGDGKTRKTAKWYGVIKDPATGKNRRVPLCEDKTAAKAMLADLIRQQDRAAAGIPTEPPRVWTLALWVADWQTSLVAKDASAKYRHNSKTAVETAFAGLERVEQVTAAAVERHLAALAKKGRSVQTRNHHLAHCKAFCEWCVGEGRLSTHPLARLRKGNAAADRRHDRRALANDEFGLLLAAAAASTETIHGLAGADRRMLFLVAAASGLRVRELASLRPSSFRLAGETPCVVCRASYAKNGKQAFQPLPPALVPLLLGYLADKPEDEPVWPGYWSQRASELLQTDLAAAGVPYATDEGFADFHALRHLYITGLCRAGVRVSTAQALARHSTPVLTLGVYAAATDQEAARAVASLALPLASEDSEGQNGESKKAG